MGTKNWFFISSCQLNLLQNALSLHYYNVHINSKIRPKQNIYVFLVLQTKKLCNSKVRPKQKYACFRSYSKTKTIISTSIFAKPIFFHLHLYIFTILFTCISCNAGVSINLYRGVPNSDIDPENNPIKNFKAWKIPCWKECKSDRVGRGR